MFLTSNSYYQYLILSSDISPFIIHLSFFKANSHCKEHVHFSAEQLKDHNLEIHVKQQEGHIDVHLGFLQIHHHYSVSFSIKDSLGQEVSFDERENLHVQIQKATVSDDGNIKEIICMNFS